MSKNINLVCDDKALLVGAAELASDLGLRLTSSGVTVNAVKGTELSVRKNGEGYVLTYRRKHEFFRGLSLIRDAVAAGAAKLRSAANTPQFPHPAYFVQRVSFQKK